MSYIDDLRKGKDKASVAFQEFALLTRLNSDHLFAFFEGKDNAYYIPRIKQYYPKVKPISCGGRDKVLKVHELIKNQTVYNKYKKAYFIDRDFHKPLAETEPPIYETNTYSLENFYVSHVVFRDIMENALHISEATDRFYQECLGRYKNLQSQYNDAITLFNAWYACLIEIRDATGQQTGVNLEDKFPKGFVELSLEGVDCKYDIELIRDKFLNSTPVSDDVLQAKVEQFNHSDKVNAFRGKYGMQFLLKFIGLILKDSANGNTLITRKLNFAFGDASGLNNDQAINIFSHYAETPPQLIAYIENVVA